MICKKWLNLIDINSQKGEDGRRNLQSVIKSAVLKKHFVKSIP